MNEDLKEQVSAIVKKAVNIAEQTGEFVIEQAPDLIREFIMFHRVEETAYILLSLLSMYLIYYISKIVVKITNNSVDYLINVLSIVPIAAFIVCLSDFIKVWVAPKLFLIEYFLK